MISGEGETVPFADKLYPRGNVEDWLTQVRQRAHAPTLMASPRRVPPRLAAHLHLASPRLTPRRGVRSSA
jgi:hypothetical protein